MAAQTLEQARNLFVRRWGEMGATWGISRTMAEVHAVLFITGKPLCTDDIMQLLQVSRGNASMNLRQLVNWGLIRRTHRRGDRKDYFVSDFDAWQMFETITRERRRREVEPIIETIERCRGDIAAYLASLERNGNGAAARAARDGQPKKRRTGSTRALFAGPYDADVFDDGPGGADPRDEARRFDDKLRDMLEFVMTMNKLLNLILAAGPGEVKRLTRLLTDPPSADLESSPRPGRRRAGSASKRP